MFEFSTPRSNEWGAKRPTHRPACSRQPNIEQRIGRQWLELAAGVILLSLGLGCGSATNVGTIGAVLGRDNEDQALYVRDVPDGLAASQAGLEPGDEIVMIDGSYVRAMPTSELRSKLRGTVGSKVALTVVRGERVLRVELARTPLSGVPLRPKAKEEKITE